MGKRMGKGRGGATSTADGAKHFQVMDAGLSDSDCVNHSCPEHAGRSPPRGRIMHTVSCGVKYTRLQLMIMYLCLFGRTPTVLHLLSL